MSVANQERPAVARFARWLLGCAVRHWPEENRAWGLALAAEIDETASAFETAKWSFGGIMLFSRSVFSSAWKWMKLPAGSSLSGGAVGPEGSSLLPKRSRVFTAVVLAVAALLLALPEGREAIRTVRSSWRGYRESGWDQRMLDELAARAEKERDASTLAFVALSTSDRAHGADLAARAVALDPQFMWVFAARNRGLDDDPPRAEWLARLQAADPGNAVPQLLVADAQVQARIETDLERGVKIDKIRQSLESDSNWLALMDSAYAAPRYDSYFQRHFELARTVWNREKSLPPTTVLYGIWQHGFPNMLTFRLYCHIKIQQSQTAQASGDTKRAESTLASLDMFGMRMAEANASDSDLEKLIGLAIARNANKAMTKLYQESGRAEDARRAATRLEQIDEQSKEMRRAFNPSRSARAVALRKEATLVQGFGILVVIAGIAALSTILLLELWRGRVQRAKSFWRRATCLVADFAPATLLVACGAFLVSFLPFQSVFEEYRSSSLPLGEERVLTDAMGSLLRIPDYVVGDDNAVALWTFVTIALSALLLFVLARGFYRMRRGASATPA
jgi:hypothetical protein